MTTSFDLLGLTQTALLGHTDAGGRAFTPGDWPTQPDQYPLLKLRVIAEDRQSLGRGGPPQFLVTTTVRILGEVSAPAAVDDAGATVAEAALWQLKRQVEVAVINSYPLTILIQQFPFIRSQLNFNSEGATHLAGIQIDVGLEFVQGPEDFAPIQAPAIAEVDITVPTYPPIREKFTFP